MCSIYNSDDVYRACRIYLIDYINSYNIHFVLFLIDHRYFTAYLLSVFPLAAL